MGAECRTSNANGNAADADDRTDQLESEAIEAGVEGLGEKKKE